MAELIDLHVHTIASDGTLTPAEVVLEAARVGLEAVAITDHDTVAGVDQALAAGEKRGLEVVPGLEFSVRFDGPGYFHLLGLLIDHRHPALKSPLARITASRAERNAVIVDKLRRLGLDITLQEVLDLSGGGQTGRAHIGQVLVNRGGVKSLDEAMARYLKKGRPAYTDRYRLEAGQAIELIHQAQGLAVMAHPVSTGLRGAELIGFLRSLKDEGLDGVEIYCPTQDEALWLRLEATAEKLGLLISGGSDFHGFFKPEIKIGFGQGNLRVKYRLLERLKAAARRSPFDSASSFQKILKDG